MGPALPGPRAAPLPALGSFGKALTAQPLGQGRGVPVWPPQTPTRSAEGAPSELAGWRGFQCSGLRRWVPGGGGAVPGGGGEARAAGVSVCAQRSGGWLAAA